MKRLASHPLSTKMMTSFCITFASDTIGQSIGGLPYSALRAMKFALYNSCFTTSINHVWFDYLDRVVLPENPKSVESVVSKTFLDQFVASPPLVGLFLCFIKFAEGRPDQALAFLAERYFSTLLNVWKVGIPLAVSMFTIIPPELRILASNIVGFSFSIFLSVTCVNN